MCLIEKAATLWKSYNPLKISQPFIKVASLHKNHNILKKSQIFIKVTNFRKSYNFLEKLQPFIKDITFHTSCNFHNKSYSFSWKEKTSFKKFKKLKGNPGLWWFHLGMLIVFFIDISMTIFKLDNFFTLKGCDNFAELWLFRKVVTFSRICNFFLWVEIFFEGLYFFKRLSLLWWVVTFLKDCDFVEGCDFFD